MKPFSSLAATHFWGGGCALRGGMQPAVHSAPADPAAVVGQQGTTLCP